MTEPGTPSPWEAPDFSARKRRTLGLAKAQQMPDFGNDEYQRMVCVESGNVASNQITLPPGETSTLSVRISSVPLG